MYPGLTPALPRPAEYWNVMRAYLRGDAALTGLLGGVPRVHIVGEDYDAGREDAQWSRVVIVPVTTAFPVEGSASRERLLRVRIRAETHLPVRRMDVVTLKLDAIHSRIEELLSGWRPAGLDYAQARLHMWLHEAPAAAPTWDERRDTWWSSAEYRTVIHPPDIAPRAALPPAPSGLTAEVVAGTVELAWSGPTDATFRVYRDGQVLTELTPGTFAYTDATVAEGEDYCYQITAVNETGESAATQMACVALPAPGGGITSPEEIPGLYLWLDASDAVNGPNGVDEWLTRAAAGLPGAYRKAGHVAPPRRDRTDGRPVIAFEETNAWFVLNNAGDPIFPTGKDITFMVLYDYAVDEYYEQTFIGQGNGTFFTTENRQKFYGRMEAEGAYVMTPTRMTMSLATPYVVTMRWTAADLITFWLQNAKIFEETRALAPVQGVENEMGSSLSSTGVRGKYLKCGVTEILYWRRALTDDEAKQAQNWLMAKWGI